MLKQPIRGMLAKQMRAKTAAKVREEHYPAPFRLIELFEHYGDDPVSMRVAETEMFAPLMASEASRNLRRVFKLSEMLKDEAPKDGFKPLRVHVIGAGTMGGDIAAWCVTQGMQASLAGSRRGADRQGACPRQGPVQAPPPHQARDRCGGRAADRRSQGQLREACRRRDRGDRREARRQAEAVRGA